MARKRQSKSAINLEESGNSGYAKKAAEMAYQRFTTYGDYRPGKRSKTSIGDAKVGPNANPRTISYQAKETLRGKMAKRKPKRAR